MLLNKKEFTIFFSVLVVSLFSVQSAFAATSLFVCPKNGAYAFSNAKDMATAKAKAGKLCLKFSKGKPCKEVFKSEKKGFGSIAIGKSADKKKRIVRVAAGFATKKEAYAAAKAAFTKAGGVKPKTKTWKSKFGT